MNLGFSNQDQNAARDSFLNWRRHYNTYVNQAAAENIGQISKGLKIVFDFRLVWSNQLYLGLQN